jgi:hypothetical protein
VAASNATNVGSLLGKFRPLQLVRAWRECAGPVLWVQTRFQGIRTGPDGPQLVIEVPDPTWRQELRFHMAEILENFRKALRKQGFPESEIPVSYSLGAGAPVPVKASQTKKSRDK